MVILKTSVLSFYFILISVNLCFGQGRQGSPTGLAFLKLGVGGRASGLGEAYSAVADEATATYWNPAGLAFISRPQLAFTHTEWIQDISNDFLAFVFPIFRGAIGLSFYSNNVGGIQRRVNPSAEPLGTVEAHDIAFGVSYGHSFNSAIKGGITVKYLYEKIFIESAAGFAFDFGVNYKPFENNLRIALAVQNLGSMGKLLGESIDLPKTLRVGVAYLVEVESIGGGILLAVDGVKVFETEFRGNFGAEIQLKEQLALRFGYQTGFDEKGLGGGFGINISRYHLEYGLTPFNSNLGDTHRFSFGLDL
ncbi:MAG: PorV/PorQ family protein [bacterium]